MEGNSSKNQQPMHTSFTPNYEQVLSAVLTLISSATQTHAEYNMWKKWHDFLVENLYRSNCVHTDDT